MATIYCMRILANFLQSFGKAVLGPAGLVIFPLLIATSTFGAANTNLYGATRWVMRSRVRVIPSVTHCRIIYSAARDGSLPESLGSLHVKQKTPVLAVVFMVN